MKNLLFIASIVFTCLQSFSSEQVIKYNLPLITINTNNQGLSADAKIIADMGFASYPEGNYTSSIYNVYSGKIAIKIRGESSSMFEKCPYTIELQNADGTNNNVSLLGLPAENDFVLYAPYSDKTLVRNVLSYQLYREFGAWAPRTRFVELIINGDYRGVYVLTEKIKQDKDRVNISKLSTSDITSPAITGGYILRIDKTTGMSSNEFWNSVTDPYGSNNEYQFFDPKYEDLLDVQKKYIKDWLASFDGLLMGSDFHANNPQYLSKIDLKSFSNMLIISELAKNVDAYRYSTYFYKKNDLKGGQLVAGPPWDFDLTYGNLDYGLNEKLPYTYDLIYNKPWRVYWWNRLMENSDFENLVNCSYSNYRKKALDKNRINSIIDSCVNYLGAAVNRNFVKFPILGKYVWPNSEYPATYEEEIDNLKAWIDVRLIWMDANMGTYCIPTGMPFVENNKNFTKVFPNPTDFSDLNIVFSSENQQLHSVQAELLDIYGKVIEKQSQFSTVTEEKLFKFSNLKYLPNGLYIYRIVSNNSVLATGKIIKN